MITLTLPMPVSANAYWSSRIVTPRGGKPFVAVYVTHEARKYKEQVAWLAKAAGVRAPIAGRVAINVRLYPHRPQDWQARQRKLGEAWDDSVQCLDLDNANKVLLDAIKEVVIEDDRWVRQIYSERMEPDAQGARVVLVVRPLCTEPRQTALILDAA